MSNGSTLCVNGARILTPGGIGGGISIHGDPDGEFIALWLCEDRVVAGMNVNVWDVPDHIRALIRSRRLVLASVLADPDASLDSLADKLSARS